MEDLLNRIKRAMRLEPALYEEVEHDRTAMTQAMLVVILSAVAAGSSFFHSGHVCSLLFDVGIALVSWFVWAYITYFLGTQVFPEPQTRSDHGELLRTLGFASSPGLIRFLGIIPGLAIISNVVASIWMLAANVIAVRQALDYTSTGRAVAVCIIGWLVYVIASGLIYVVSFGLLSFN